MNNATFFTADRATHLKIVAVALLAAMAVSLMGISFRATTANPGTHLRTANHDIAAL
jgi:hypothetical protein